jgi:uncharacterized protein (DUF433 family)
MDAVTGNEPLPIVLIPHPHVRIDKAVLGGSPYVVGSRVPVRRLWAFYRSGASVEVLIKRFPRLGAGKIFDALAFAFDNREVVEQDLRREQFLLATDKPKHPPQMDLPFDRRNPSPAAVRSRQP